MNATRGYCYLIPSQLSCVFLLQLLHFTSQWRVRWRHAGRRLEQPTSFFSIREAASAGTNYSYSAAHGQPPCSRRSPDTEYMTIYIHRLKLLFYKKPPCASFLLFSLSPGTRELNFRPKADRWTYPRNRSRCLPGQFNSNKFLSNDPLSHGESPVACKPLDRRRLEKIKLFVMGTKRAKVGAGNPFSITYK